MKKIFSVLLVLSLLACSVFAFASCSAKQIGVTVKVTNPDLIENTYTKTVEEGNLREVLERCSLIAMEEDKTAKVLYCNVAGCEKEPEEGVLSLTVTVNGEKADPAAVIPDGAEIHLQYSVAIP